MDSNKHVLGCNWMDLTYITVPAWLVLQQQKLQKRLYEDDQDKMNLVFDCASTNAKAGTGAPLAAAVFLGDGTLVSIGVDAPGMGGHEMTNALLMASNALGPKWFNDRKVSWDFFSLAPPCTICLGHIFGLRPFRFVSSVLFEDLLSSYQFPNTPFPKEDWKDFLGVRQINVVEAFQRKEGVSILQAGMIG